MRRTGWWSALAFLVAAVPGWAQPVAQQITAADTGLLFGGSDAEGGIGDWYLSNGVVQAIVDDVGIQEDLVGIVPAGTEPTIQSSISPTGGTMIDIGLVGRDNDQIPQLFVVGGLSTANFVLYDAISVAAPGVLRAIGKLLIPPVSARPTPCIDLVTDFAVAGTDPFFTLTTTATNGCAEAAPFGNFLDAIIWTQRGIVPFSGGGRGFDHPILNFDDLPSALETPTFLAGPGIVNPGDGVFDPVSGTASGEVSYGLLGIELTVDQDGAGGDPPVVFPTNSFFGVSSTLVTALGHIPPVGAIDPGGILTYTRRVYVGGRNDVRSVADPMIAALAARVGFTTGTLSGDVAATDTADVAASIVITRVGRCTGAPTTSCTAIADCGGTGPCTDPVSTTGFTPGQAVSHVRTEPTGTFAGVVLPLGDYRLVVSAPERDDVTVAPVTLAGGDTVASIPAMTARGVLQYEVREKAKKRPAIPAKLVIKGVDGTPDPAFARSLPAKLGDADVRAETFGGGQEDASDGTVAQANVIYTSTGSGTVPIRPGTYDVYATRGMEYGVAQERVTVTAGSTASVAFRLKRVIRTKDALAADFHVHSGRSFDSSTPPTDRVTSFAAEGVEVMVSTDHDKNFDYAPLIAALNLASQIGAIAGSEVTGSVPNPPAFPNSFGHINAWPLPVEPGAPRDGAIQDEFVAPNWLYTRLRALGGPDTVVQYNHVRAGVSGLTTIGFFNSIGCSRCANAIDTPCTVDTDCPAGVDRECTCVGYQPDRPLTEPPNDILLDSGVLGPGSAPNPNGTTNLDFDVMELANSADVTGFPSLLQVREDWFSLLNQGVVRPATGVSDSHRLTLEHPGWSRTYVLGVGDDPATIDVSRFNQQVRAGAMLVSGGPWIEVTARAGRARAGMGGTLAVTKGKVRLAIVVRSPAWLPVDEVRVVVNGAVQATFGATTRPRVKPLPKNFESSGNTTRFSGSVRLTLPADAWVVVEAGVALPADPSVPPPSPGIVDVVEPGVVPFSSTNPIFIDVGGDGFTAPGLPAALTARARGRSGRMTGVRRADRIEAARHGEHFPLTTFRIPIEEVPR
jgi:hypothetical protein